MKHLKMKYLFSALIALVAAVLLVFAAPTLADTADTATLEATLADASTELQVKTALLEKIGWDMLTVDVEATGNHVWLMGTADNRSNQELAKEVALSVEGVEKVTNKLTLDTEKSDAPVGDAVTDAELEVKDAVLESRVKTELITEMGANAFDIEVEATAGRVSLRGELDNESHKDLALKTVKSCSGVDNVVDLLTVAG